MKRYIILLVALFIFCPKVEAVVCDNAKMVNYQEIAKNITYTYNFNESNNTFDVTLTNVDSNFHFINVETNERYENSGSETTLNNLNQGTSYKLGVYTNDIDCRNSRLYTIYIALPYYNPYYNDELCSGIENYKYCKKYITFSLTREQFEERVKSYINKQIGVADTEEKHDDNHPVIDFLSNIDNYMYYVLAIVIGLSFLIYRYYYNKKQDLF